MNREELIDKMAAAIEKTKEETKKGVIKEYMITPVVNWKTGEETGQAAEYINRGMDELAKKEREGIEYILCNLIDDPITGDITIEKLRERNIISFVYYKHLPPTKIEEQGNKMEFIMYSDFFGIRQGAYIVRPNGERVEIDYQVLSNTRQDFIDYSRQ